jgi:BirA family biotin operon repressor/biotin-[acetyl-CoA-carboxylase] ligase
LVVAPAQLRLGGFALSSTGPDRTGRIAGSDASPVIEELGNARPVSVFKFSPSDRLLRRGAGRRAVPPLPSRYVTTDTQILMALRAAELGGVSGAELSQRLGITRAAIWARIEELRKLGYEIEASPVLGYRLISTPDVLHADDLLARLGKTKVIGRDIRVFEQTSSTNDVVEKLARDGVKEGVVVFAESQIKGRGRLGRVWASPARKGLWFSILLRPDLRPQETTQLTVAAATAIWRAIHAVTGLQPEIKWPNDLLYHGKKLVGILTELSAEVDRVKHVILGVGVSVNVAAGEFPADLRKAATSLRIELGKPVLRAELATAILRELDANYDQVCRGKFPEIADEWEEHCSTIGQQVVVMIGERKIRGCAESIDDDGALLLRTEHGRLERIIGGDVTLEK